MKLVEVKTAKEFASTFFGDPVLKMAVNAALDNAPGIDAIPVNAEELKHLMNDTIDYIWKLEERGCNKPEFGYESRKALLEKMKKFYNEHFPEHECAF